MARGVPDEGTYQPEVTPEDLPRKLVPRANEAFAAPAIEGAANAIDRKYQADSATFAGDQLAQFRRSALQSLDAAKTALPAGSDPSNFSSSYLTQFDKQAAPLAQAAQGNSVAQTMLNKGVSDLRNTLQDHTIAWQAQQQVAYRSDTFDNNLKTQSALVEAHPELAGQVGSTLTDQANLIGGDPSSRLTRMRTMAATLAQATANGLTRQDPRGMLQALNDPDHAPEHLRFAVSDLSDAQREAVRAKANEHLGDAVYTALENQNFRSAQLALSKNEDLLDPKAAENLQRSINAQVEMSRSMNDRAQHDASDSLLKNAILMQSQGTLTPAYIEKYHATWEPAAYEYAYKLLSGKEAQTDPHVFAPLLQRSLSGEDVSQDATQALYSGRLTKSDYQSLVTKVETPRGNFVKNGANYIEQALKPSPLLYKPDAALDYANALDDFHNWVSDNPKATPDEGMARARSIAQNYAFVQADKAITFGPVPAYLKGTRQIPDIASTWAATKQAHDTGHMSDAEFARQSALIMTWSTYQHAQQTKPKAQAQ